MKRFFLLTAILATVAFGQSSGPRARVGDDPAWASPQFDDSAWLPFPAVAPPQSYADLIHNVTWTRWRVQVPTSEPMLFRASCLTDCRLWLDGQPVGDHAGSRVARVVVPAPPGKWVTVAVRSWLPPGTGMLGQNYGRIELRPAVELALRRGDSVIVPHMVTALALAVILLYVLLQTLTGRASRDVRIRTALMAVFLIGNGGSFATATEPAISAVFTVVVAPVLVALVGLDAGGVRRGWMVGFLAAYFALRLPYVIGAFFERPAPWTPLAVRLYLASLVMILALILFLRERARRRGASTWLMAAAVVAYPLYILNLTRPDWFPAGIPMASLVFRWNQIASLTFGMAIAVDVVRQNRREQAAAVRLQGELDSGRQAQLDLVSYAKASTPGYEVEGHYQPAAEVGGDFYQVLSRNDGSQLVVLGDVSGKGLKAAMVASAAVGALRHSEESAPGEVLAGLNRTFLGQTGGGFITCCCLRLAPDGQVTIASAGHGSPYSNGQEIPVDAGLPLGVVAEASWPETRFTLPPDGQITIVSDGVLEAENATRELFGFDRTRAISVQAAQAIAEAARAWGQNDDITVVTVRRTA